MEEMEETSAILRSATSRSLVIIDELGRGTSTHDGVAIALATLEHLLHSTRCFTLFVTHYPRVAQVATVNPSVMKSFYMAFHQPLTDTKEHVKQEEAPTKMTFLYKLVQGVSERSFGLNVARMATMPESVVQRAAVKAGDLEASVNDRKEQRRTAQHFGDLHSFDRCVHSSLGIVTSISVQEMDALCRLNAVVEKFEAVSPVEADIQASFAQLESLQKLVKTICPFS